MGRLASGYIWKRMATFTCNSYLEQSAQTMLAIQLQGVSMLRPLLRLLLILHLIGIPSISIAQQNIDIVQIMGQFVQANYAVSKCSKPDQQILTKFNSNFRIVTIRATEEMMKRKPGTTEKQVSDVFKKGSDEVEKKIDEVISAKGCSDPRIQDLLKRFEIQASLKL